MHISSLRLHHYRRFEDASFEFQPGVNVLYGANGAGKTTVLETAATLLSWYAARLKSPTASGKFPDKKAVANGSSSALVELRVETEASSVSSSLFKRKAGHEAAGKSEQRQVSQWALPYRVNRSEGVPVDYPLFAFYGVKRVGIDIPQRIRNKHDFDALAGYDNAFEGGSEFRSFFDWFRQREDLENEERVDNTSHRDFCLQAVRTAWEKMLPEFSGFRIRRKKGLALTAVKDGVELSMDQLSDGERCFLALVGDIARRLALLQMTARHAEDILNGCGIVLIDELDLHLHPLWQRRAARELPRVFPSLQFIITTHSPQVLSEVRADRIIPLSRSAAAGVGYGFSSADILELSMESDIWPEEIRAGIRKVHAQLDKGNVQKAQAVLAKMRQSLPADSPILASLQTEISLFG